MSSPSLSRRAAACSALALAGTVLLGAPADAAPGDNGTVKIHTGGPVGVRTPKGDPRDEPKVCKFYIDAFNFDTVQYIDWTIATQPPVVGGAHLAGSVMLVGGAGYTKDMVLPDGQYKLVWKIRGGNGAGKQKVFKVDCRTTPSPTPSATYSRRPGGAHGGPHGGPPAGGGGLAREASITPVAGAAAVGLAAVSGAVWFRLRRRPHGAA
jgi:hypothetical protein